MRLTQRHAMGAAGEHVPSTTNYKLSESDEERQTAKFYNWGKKHFPKSLKSSVEISPSVHE